MHGKGKGWEKTRKREGKNIKINAIVGKGKYIIQVVTGLWPDVSFEYCYHGQEKW